MPEGVVHVSTQTAIHEKPYQDRNAAGHCFINAQCASSIRLEIASDLGAPILGTVELQP
jgi:hypothetical protein